MTRLAFDVVVVGAGPAGVAAAVRAAARGASVGLIDDNPAIGGQIWRGGADQDRPGAAQRWMQRVHTSDISIHTRTRVIASLARGVLLAEAPDGATEIYYQRLILAPGARERFLPFPGWTLPGIYGAGGLQALVKGGLPIAGKRVVVAGSGPLLLAVAAYLVGHGARVRVLAEQASLAALGSFSRHLLDSSAKLRQAGTLFWILRTVPLRASCWIVRAHGREQLEAVTLRRGARTWTVRCDYLACGFGLVPNLYLSIAVGCATDGSVIVDEWQRTSVEGVYCAGEAAGVGGLETALVEGEIAGFAATGQTAAARARFGDRARARRFARALERHFSLRPELRHLAEDDTVLCRCEDVLYGAVKRHASWRSAKLHTRCGMGPCQGRVCGAASEFLFGWAPDAVRPPITPARLGSLALAEPARV
jgi:NADPH-dependent 2,4-dienoyl-CoA reductase/sulfur reductase-like enzyme